MFMLFIVVERLYFAFAFTAAADRSCGSCVGVCVFDDVIVNEAKTERRASGLARADAGYEIPRPAFFNKAQIVKELLLDSCWQRCQEERCCS